jgi:hypothetical protein
MGACSILSSLETRPATSITEPLPTPEVDDVLADVALEVELIATMFYFGLRSVKAKKYGSDD